MAAATAVPTATVEGTVEAAAQAVAAASAVENPVAAALAEHRAAAEEEVRWLPNCGRSSPHTLQRSTRRHRAGRRARSDGASLCAQCCVPTLQGSRATAAAAGGQRGTAAAARPKAARPAGGRCPRQRCATAAGSGTT
eukprot:7378133-Prymnesium_polylepis.1